MPSAAATFAARFIRARLPRDWEWKAAVAPARPLVAEVHRLRIPESEKGSLAYEVESSIREVLRDPRALARLRQRLEKTPSERAAKQALAAWREERIAAGLERARKAIDAGKRELEKLAGKISAMDARKLHAFANRYNWDEGIWAMDMVARHPKCALGTALLVYWLAKPHWYLQWKTAKASDDPTAFEMLRFIEQRVKRGGYEHAGIAFDPRDEDFTSDTYDDEKKVRSLPSHMLIATTKRDVIAIKAS